MADRMADTISDVGSDFSVSPSQLPSCFSFDPNTLTDEGYKRLGLTEKQVIMIRKYLDKGGQFRTKHDFSKMYCISKLEFEHFRDCLLLPDTLVKASKYGEMKFDEPNISPESFPKPNYYAPIPVVVELNTADTISIRKVKGIGPYYARKIIAYRDRLGGFVSRDQLLEVYRMTPEKLDSIAPFITADQNLVHKININTITEQELSQHPYLTRTQCKALISYREKHGPFASINNVTDCLSIDQKTFEKIRFYLDVH